MYRLTIKDKTINWHTNDSSYDTVTTEHRYNCETLQQLTGLLEFMVQTSDKEIDCTIERLEDDDE